PPWVARLPSRRRRGRWAAARRPGRVPRTLLRGRSLAWIPDDHPRAGGSDLTGRRPRAVSHAGHDEGLPGLGSTPPPLPRQGGTLSRQEPRPRTEARFKHRDDRHVRDGVPRRDARPDGLVGSVPRRTSPLGHAFRYCHVDVIFLFGAPVRPSPVFGTSRRHRRRGRGGPRVWGGPDRAPARLGF